MTRVSAITATLLSALVLVGCNSTGDSDRAMLDQVRRDTASAKASADAARQSAEAARAAETSARQMAQQTGATAPPPSRAATDQGFRQAQRK